MFRAARRRALTSLTLAALLACLSAGGPASAQNQTQTAPPIQYKTGGPSVAAEGLRVFGILAVVLGVAGGALLYLKRRYPSLILGRGQGTLINVLETRRVSPRLSISVVEVDGARVLLTQSGDRVTSTVLPPRPAPVPPQSSS
jgi:flagellar biogenesis protein FliO